MLNYDPSQSPADQVTPAALRAMHWRFAAWCLTGAALGMAVTLAFSAPASGRERHTGAALHPWSYSLGGTFERLPDGPAHPVVPVERKPLPPIKGKRDRSEAETLRDLYNARRAMDRLILQQDMQWRHSHGIVNPDEL